MYARISRISGAAENSDQGVASFKETTLPEVRSLSGNRGSILLIDRASGDAMAITLWNDEEAMQASDERANQLRSEASEQMGAEGHARVERYEVAVLEM